MKISLIEPRSPNYHVYTGQAIPRLGLPILGTILRQRGHEVKIYVEDLRELTPAAAWTILKSDLVGISITSSTAPRGYAMARLLRLKGVPVVFGGVHASFLPDEAAQYADYVICGEAEESFPMLVEALESGGDLSKVPNLVYRDGQQVIHNPRQRLCLSLDEIPIPDLSIIEGNERLGVYPVMTSRGCPHNCTFCCVTRMFGRRYRLASVERVLEEIEPFRGKNVFFCDDNFTGSTSRTKELLEKMLSRSVLPRRWYAQVRADIWRDSELMELMKRTHCKRVYVGFESADQRVLDELNKHQQVEDIKRCVAQFHRYDIAVHGMFMFGAEHDDLETFDKTAGFAIDSHIDTVQFLILTPVPGSGIFQQLEAEGRLLTCDWSLYDGHHVVFQPKQMSPWELQVGTIRANRRFYSVPSVLRSLSCFRFGTAMLRYWGKKLVTRWQKSNAGFLQKLNAWQKGAMEFPRRFSLRQLFDADAFQALLSAGGPATEGGGTPLRA